MSTAAVRPPAVAGLFYPDCAAALGALVDRYCGQVVAPPALPAPSALVVPHAGYVYSGAVAGRGYGLLGPDVRRVVILGPSHRVRLRGVALSRADAFATPLGTVPVDVDEARGLADLLPHVVHWRDDAHALEHAIEVQIPFVQRRCPRAKILPLVVGDSSPEDVEAVLELCAPDEGTVLVVSTDLSHYLGYEQAQQYDASTSEAILALEEAIEPEQACGCRPLNGLLRYARSQRWRVRCLDRCTSGDTAGTKDRVVGYATYALHPA